MRLAVPKGNLKVCFFSTPARQLRELSMKKGQAYSLQSDSVILLTSLRIFRKCWKVVFCKAISLEEECISHDVKYPS